ncbi:MAG: GldM family protein [Bacteroidota bacterium]
MNVLYAGIENPVTVSCAEDFDSLYLEGAEINSIAESDDEKASNKFKKFIITPGTSSGKKYFLLYKYGKIISKSEVRIKRLPDPIGALESYENGSSIPKGLLKVSSKLFVRKPPGLELNVNYTITKWSITIINSDKAMSASGNGASLSAEAIKQLEMAENGSRIIIDMNSNSPDGISRQVSINLKVN